MASYDLFQGSLSEEVVEWLYSLPPQAELDGILYVHGSPLSDVESFPPEPSGDDERMLAGVSDRTVVFGHSHQQFRRPGPNGTHLVNPGSVGMPLDGDVRAAWATWDGDFEFRRTEYDVARGSRLPVHGGEFGEFAAGGSSAAPTEVDPAPRRILAVCAAPSSRSVSSCCSRGFRHWLRQRGSSKGTNPSDPHVAMGAHLFVQFAVRVLPRRAGQGRRFLGCPSLKDVGRVADSQPAELDHQPRARRVGQPAEAVHAGLGAGDLGEAGLGSRLVHHGRPAEGAGRRPRPGAARPGRRRLPARLSTCATAASTATAPAGSAAFPNPQSEDKTIPPLSGGDFREEFNTDEKITDLIRSGSVLGKPPIASMPHWGGIIPDEDLAALVAYLKTLK